MRGIHLLQEAVLASVAIATMDAEELAATAAFTEGIASALRGSGAPYHPVMTSFANCKSSGIVHI